MSIHTKAYLRFKAEAERLANFVALVSHAVPVLRRVIGDPKGASTIRLKPADNFPHDRSDAATLAQWESGYSDELARLVVLATFSYFESYVRAALNEVFEIQGGAIQFLQHVDRRATRRWTATTANIAAARRRLQKPDDGSKTERIRKYTKILEKAGYRFPSDILGAYGTKQLWMRIDPKNKRGLTASGIPELLTDALLMNVTPAQRRMFEDLRDLRNKSCAWWCALDWSTRRDQAHDRPPEMGRSYRRARRRPLYCDRKVRGVGHALQRRCTRSGLKRPSTPSRLGARYEFPGLLVSL